MTREISCLTLLAACLAAGQPAVAAPLALLQQGIAVTDLGAPSTFGITFGAPLAGVTGPVQVTTYVIGVYADGARDGASVGLALNPTVATGKLSPGGGSPQAVTGAGGPSALSAAGGTGGQVQFGAVSVSDAGTPSSFGFVLGQPMVVSGRQLAQSHVAAVVMDLGGDGAAATGDHPGGEVAASAFAGRPPHNLAGSGFSASGLTGTMLDTDAALVDCGASPSCDLATITLMIGLSGGGDSLAMLARHEVGGDELLAPVMAEYALASHSAQFDCGAAGCDFHTVDLSFTGSGGNDLFGFIVRQEIHAVGEPVPAPASLLLAGAALAILAVGRRRRGGGASSRLGPLPGAWRARSSG